MPKLKSDHISPSDEENVAIRAGIAADPDARELDDAWFVSARPAKEVLPPALYAALSDKSKPAVFRHVTDAEYAAAMDTKRSRGRPPIDNPKIPTTIRLDADVMEAFRAGGQGWQTRINAVLREAVAAGRV